MRGCRVDPAKVGTLSGFLDNKMQSSSCQSWYFVWDFGYEDTKLIVTNLVLCLCFSI